MTGERLTVDCRQCRAELAERVNGHTLRIATRLLVVTHKIALPCPNCGYVTRWYPAAAENVLDTRPINASQ